MIRTTIILMLISSKIMAMPWSFEQHFNQTSHQRYLMDINPDLSYLSDSPPQWIVVKALLEQQPSLQKAVIEKTINALSCAHYYGVDYNPIISIIDYSLPANEKRFWSFNINELTLLHHTYVSHGITSGQRFSRQFSNINDSKASSIGVFTTGESYYGREGYSLRLNGLEHGFNHQAMRRYIVMHGGWYMDESFIKQYGRPGRSWGCPSFPLNETKSIINDIRNNTLLIVYYPEDTWLSQSRFLNCPAGFDTSEHQTVALKSMPVLDDREPVLFHDKDNNNERDDHDLLAVMKAKDYQPIFKQTPPLLRMLRRPIDHDEYIALSLDEIKQINSADLDKIKFIVPEVVKTRGVYQTHMKLIAIDKIIAIEPLINNEQPYASVVKIKFQNKPDIELKQSHRFIRWLGL